MKYPVLLFAIFLNLWALISCTSQGEKNSKSQTADTLQVGVTKDSLSDLRSFSNAILNDGLAPGDNALTLMCLDSLLSPDKSVRDHYFKVFLVIAAKADGVLTELVSATGLDYLEQFPEEAMARYELLSDLDKELFSDKLAYDFYASGGQIKGDVQDYFQDIEMAIPVDKRPLVKDLKNAIVAEAQELKAMEQE